MATQQNKLNGSFISISAKDSSSEKSVIKQMADILESDITDNVRRYEVYEKPNASDSTKILKSSLFQTVLDQPLENSAVANELFDITMGTYAQYNSETNNYTVLGKTVSVDNAGKLFVADGDSESDKHYNVREKISIYRQFAQMLLGDADKQFTTKASVDESAVAANPGVNEPKLIEGAIFLCFKRLFVNDNIAKGSFELNIFEQTAEIREENSNSNIATTFKNLINVDHQGSANVINDSSSQVFISVSSGGEVGTLFNGSSPVGLIYYDSGIVVLDTERVLDLTQPVKGHIDSNTANNTFVAEDTLTNTDATDAGEELIYFIGHLKSFLFRAGLDDIIDHIRQRIRKTRNYASVASSVNSAISFSSEMFINSTLLFCRAAPSQCNLSSNPTYTDSEGKIHATFGTNGTFSYVTTVGLYDGNGELLAVAKTSRPIEKNAETDLSIRVRIDY